VNLRKKFKKLIFINFCITLFFFSSILYKGIKYEFEEEKMLPENEIFEANQQILKNYTNEYNVIILVNSSDLNILRKDKLI
jgi:predicted RND superfamily exporter protein